MRILFGVIVFILLICGHTRANAVPGCGFYARVSRACGCRDSNNYFLKSGGRYCELFRNSTGWTPAGARWRDRTFVCLERALARGIARLPGGGCDCKSAEAIAWQTHVDCYTEASASVCRLPLSDITKIYRMIDAADLLSPLAIGQILAIAGRCALSAH
jgi:hypothetical protein